MPGDGNLGLIVGHLLVLPALPVQYWLQGDSHHWHLNHVPELLQSQLRREGGLLVQGLQLGESLLFGVNLMMVRLIKSGMGMLLIYP